jgi:hypothetical protein
MSLPLNLSSKALIQTEKVSIVTLAKSVTTIGYRMKIVVKSRGQNFFENLLRP